MYNIPKDQLPNEWKDESRLDSLFSPFRSRTVNPKDWESKIASWKSIISLYCVNNGIYTFSLSFLNKLFVRHGRPPSCLPAVVEELMKNGELQYIEDFLKKTPSSWSGWTADLLLKRPLVWSYKTVRRSLFPTTTSQDQILVYLEVIRSESQKLLEQIPAQNIDKVISFSELLKILDKDANQAHDMKLLLHHLANEGKVQTLVLEQNKGNVDTFLLKFTQSKPSPISEIDVSIYLLEQNEVLFTKHTENLEDEIAKCVKEVKAHLLKGHKQLAKTCLRKKHEIDKRLTRKVNALHNVQTLLEKIKDVHTDADVWHSYQHALSAFNNTYKETGLTEDAVEDTMLKLGEMLDIHSDIQSTISKPVQDDYDEDLESELEDLIKSDNKPEEPAETITNLEDLDEQLAKLQLDSFPDVPSHNVSSQETSVHQ